MAEFMGIDSQGNNHPFEFTPDDLITLSLLTPGGKVALSEHRVASMDAKDEYKILDAEGRAFFIILRNGQFETDPATAANAPISIMQNP